MRETLPLKRNWACGEEVIKNTHPITTQRRSPRYVPLTCDVSGNLGTSWKDIDLGGGVEGWPLTSLWWVALPRRPVWRRGWKSQQVGEHAGINPCVAGWIMVLILELLREIDTRWKCDTGSAAKTKHRHRSHLAYSSGVLFLTHACLHTHTHTHACVCVRLYARRMHTHTHTHTLTHSVTIVAMYILPTVIHRKTKKTLF